jgi:hypothetical protein
MDNFSILSNAKSGEKMQKSSQRLDNFISESTRGVPSPIPAGEDMGGDRVWSGEVAEIDERTYRFYMNDNAGPPKMKQDDWFIFSDARLVTQPGVLFWQRGAKYFARRLDEAAWERFLKVAKVKRAIW